MTETGGPCSAEETAHAIVGGLSPERAATYLAAAPVGEALERAPVSVYLLCVLGPMEGPGTGMPPVG